MNNEAGIDNPPPPYGAATATARGSPAVAQTQPRPPARSATASAPASAGAATPHIELSRFTHADKAQFFALLDEYFASKGADVTPAY